MVFKLSKQNAYSSKTILGLPAELRLKILRNLLRREELIYSEESFLHVP